MSWYFLFSIGWFVLNLVIHMTLPLLCTNFNSKSAIEYKRVRPSCVLWRLQNVVTGAGSGLSVYSRNLLYVTFG